MATNRILRDHGQMEIYRVNLGDWFPSLEEALASAEDGWVHLIEQSEQTVDGVRPVVITIND